MCETYLKLTIKTLQNDNDVVLMFLLLLIGTDYTHFFGVFIADVAQVNADRDLVEVADTS